MRAFTLLRRALPMLVLVSAFLVIYEATVSDSRFAARQAELNGGSFRLSPGDRVQFEATAYCKGTTTASGVTVRSGIAAADRTLLPVGSVVQAEFESAAYDGLYTIMDTGPEIKGRELDVYMWSCHDALKFGRQPVHIMVLRLGWNPRDTTPLLETLFPRRTPPGPDRDKEPAAPERPGPSPKPATPAMTTSAVVP
jgi:3D (Asp-Asp-Asp) domain-containing protein